MQITPGVALDLIIGYLHVDETDPQFESEEGIQDLRFKYRNCVQEAFDALSPLSDHGVVDEKLRQSTASSRGYARNNQSLHSYYNHYTQAYEEHVRNSKNFILQAASGLSGRVVVLGPGCVEPLKQLAQQFDQMVLVDYDEETLQKLAASLPKGKVSYIKLDLTGGLIARIDDFFAKEQAKKEVSKLSDLLLNIAKIFSSFKPDVNVANVIGQADLVVSSLVSCQLASLAVKYAKTRLQEHCSETGVRMSVMAVFEEASVNLDRYLISNHFCDLHALTKPEGRAYWADTTQSFNFQLSHNGSSNFLIIIPDAVIDLQKKYFSSITAADWPWKAMPPEDCGFGRCFTISARILKSPTAQRCVVM